MIGYSSHWCLSSFKACEHSLCLRVWPGLWFSFYDCDQHHHRHPNRLRSSPWRSSGSADSPNLAIFGQERRRRHYHRQSLRTVRVPPTTIFRSFRTWIAYGAAGMVPRPHCTRRLSGSHLQWWHAVWPGRLQHTRA